MKMRYVGIMMTVILSLTSFSLTTSYCQQEEWTLVEAGAGGVNFIKMDRPITTWTFSKQPNSPAFVHYFRILPKNGTSVWFDVRMMGKPMIKEGADAEKIAKNLKIDFENDETVTSKVILKKIIVDGTECAQLIYTEKGDDVNVPAIHVDNIIIIGTTWFLVQYEVPPGKYQQYKPIFDKMLASFKIDREKLEQFWESQRLSGE